MRSFMYVPVGVDHEPATLVLTHLTNFQVDSLCKIVCGPDFDFTCQSEISRRGPVMFLWYDRDGFMHARRIGREAILWSFDGEHMLKSVA